MVRSRTMFDVISYAERGEHLRYSKFPLEKPIRKINKRDLEKFNIPVRLAGRLRRDFSSCSVSSRKIGEKFFDGIVENVLGGNGLLIMGGTLPIRTFLGVLYLVKAMTLGAKPLYTTCAEAVNCKLDGVNSVIGEYYFKDIMKYSELVFIDQLGREGSHNIRREAVHQILSDRYNRGRSVVLACMETEETLKSLYGRDTYELIKDWTEVVLVK